MDRIPLLGGSYQARSIIANAQRCVNYYPEVNRQDSPVPFTYYQRPGLRPLAQGPVAPVRGLYRASNGNGYAVIGQGVYSIATNWALTLLGTLVAPAITPVSMIDNGTTLMLVDNSAVGYTIDLATNAFAQIVDPTGTFTGATRVDYIDTFVLWNVPNTRVFGSTLSNSISFDALYIAGKAGYPDPLSTLLVNRREIVLLGQLKSEVWYDAGNAGFPFAELPGAYIEHGTVAPYSVASNDIEVFWLGQDLQGSGVVFSLRGYDTRRISNHALEFALREMRLSGTISDAIGYTYQSDGHVFYVLTFPSGNQTWVYDVSLGGEPTVAWHQRAYTDDNGNLNRDRGMSCANLYGQNIVGDFALGTIYALDPDYYVDTVGGVDRDISYIKGFPHLQVGTNRASGQRVGAGGQLMQFGRFFADIECGNGPLDAAGNPAQIGLAWSIDRGKTFGNEVLQSGGAPGEWIAQPQWSTSVISRDIVFELRHNIAGEAALQGAWVEAQVVPG